MFDGHEVLVVSLCRICKEKDLENRSGKWTGLREGRESDRYSVRRVRGGLGESKTELETGTHTSEVTCGGVKITTVSKS